MSVPTGLYYLVNVASGTALDLSNGNPANGTIVQGWPKLPSTSSFVYDQIWFFVPVPGAANTYVIYNTRSGTVLQLKGASKVNGTQAEGWARVTSPTSADRNQQWTLSPLSGGSFRLTNKQTGTALDLANGGGAAGTKVQGWAIPGGGNNQHWLLQRVTSP